MTLLWLFVLGGLQRPSGPPATDSTPVGAAATAVTAVRGPFFAAVLPSHDPATSLAATDTARSRRPGAVRYSDEYYKRLTVHRDVSYAMIPLFIAEYALGQSLYNQTGPADTLLTSASVRSWHRGVADAIGVLFVVNTYTGFLNLEESSRAPEGRTRREVHAALMILSELGFVATGQLTPGRGGAVSVSRRDTHRTVAMLSISTALVGDVMMLIWNH